MRGWGPMPKELRDLVGLEISCNSRPGNVQVDSRTTALRLGFRANRTHSFCNFECASTCTTSKLPLVAECQLQGLGFRV